MATHVPNQINHATQEDSQSKLLQLPMEIQRQIWAHVFEDTAFLNLCIQKDNSIKFNVLPTWTDNPCSPLSICRSVRASMQDLLLQSARMLYFSTDPGFIDSPYKDAAHTNLCILLDQNKALRKALSRIDTLVIPNSVVSFTHLKPFLDNVSIVEVYDLTLLGHVERRPTNQAQLDLLQRQPPIVDRLDNVDRNPLLKVLKQETKVENVKWHTIWRWFLPGPITTERIRLQMNGFRLNSEWSGFYKRFVMTSCIADRGSGGLQDMTAPTPPRHYVEHILSFDMKTVRLIGLRRVPYDLAEPIPTHCDCPIENELAKCLRRFNEIRDETLPPPTVAMNVFRDRYIKRKGSYERHLAAAYKHVE